MRDYGRLYDSVLTTGARGVRLWGMKTTYTVQFRSMGRQPARIFDFSDLASAVVFGLIDGGEFDVSVDSGAVVWVWEQR